MKKDHLLGILQTIKNNYALTQAGIALMAQQNAKDILTNTFNNFSGNKESDSLSFITYVFENDKLLIHSTNELRKSVLRNSLKETFEAVSYYAEKKHCLPTLKKAPWFQFLRVIRNCLSHDFVLRINKSDKKHLPIKWSNLEINLAMADEVLPMQNFLTRYKSVELIDDITNYVRSEFP